MTFSHDSSISRALTVTYLDQLQPQDVQSIFTDVSYIKEVTPHRARLVLRSVTVHVYTVLVLDQPPKLT